MSKYVKLPAEVMESLLCRSVQGVSPKAVRKGVAVLSGPLQDEIEYELIGEKVHIFCLTDRVVKALFVDDDGVALRLLTALLRHNTEVHAPDCTCKVAPPSKRGSRAKGAEA